MGLQASPNHRACVFEVLHLVPMRLLVGLPLCRIAEGRPDLAAENTLVNLAVNVHPILHHSAHGRESSVCFGSPRDIGGRAP